MGKLTMFAIQLDKKEAVYEAGEHVRGRLCVELAAPIKMRGLHIRFSGKARVHWTKSRSSGAGKFRRTHTDHYTNDETYFEETSTLFGKAFRDRTGENPVLEAGSHVYPFDFVLPADLPSSLEAGVGWVRYHLEGVIDKPWSLDHRTKRPFTVLQVLDLNEMPDVYEGVEAEGKKTICCYCCGQGPITGRLLVDHKGFVPGENLLARVDISNRSRRKIKDFTLSINQVRVFYGYHNGKLYKKVSAERVASVKGPAGVGRGETETFPDVCLPIPPLPPSLLQGCSIIDIHYSVNLAVNPSGMSTDLHVSGKIIVGTIPVNRSWSLGHSLRPATSFGDQAGASAPPPYGQPATLPPSYAECTMGKINIYDSGEEGESGKTNDRIHGDTLWAPSYMYYNFNTQYDTQYGTNYSDPLPATKY